MAHALAPAELARLFGLSVLFVCGTMVTLALVQRSLGGARRPRPPARR